MRERERGEIEVMREALVANYEEEELIRREMEVMVQEGVTKTTLPVEVHEKTVEGRE